MKKTQSGMATSPVAIVVTTMVGGGLKILALARGSCRGSRPQRKKFASAEKWHENGGGGGNLANKTPSLVVTVAPLVVVMGMG